MRWRKTETLRIKYKVKWKKAGEIETLTDRGEEQRKVDVWSPLGRVSSTISDKPTWSPPEYPGSLLLLTLSFHQWRWAQDMWEKYLSSHQALTDMVGSCFPCGSCSGWVEFLKMATFLKTTFSSENEVSKSLGKKQPITPQEKTNSAENLLLPVAKVSELKTCISNVECDCVW